jgi:hypothetical protein
VLLRAEIDAVLADWAWHLDHGDYDAVVELFTEDALFITGSVELRGRPAIRNRYTERVVARSTRHIYSGLRIKPVPGYFHSVPGPSGRYIEVPSAVRAAGPTRRRLARQADPTLAAEAASTHARNLAGRARRPGP